MSFQDFQPGDPKFEVVLTKSGRVLQVGEYRYQQDFLAATDSFSFRYYSENHDDMPWFEMQPVMLQIDGRPQLVGRIDATDTGDQGSSVHCEGRDYISDLMEPSVDPKVIFTDGMTLRQALSLLLAPCGITAIEDQGKVISSRTGKYVKPIDNRLDAKTVKDLKPEAGRGVYQVAEEILARFGVMLQPTINRSAVVVQGPTYDQDPIGRIACTKGEPNRNLVINGGGRARRDYSSFPTHTIFTGKQGLAAEKGGAKGTVQRWSMFEKLETFPQEMRDILRGAIVQGRRLPEDDSQIPEGVLYRLLYHRDDKIGKTHEQIGHSMMRAISDRLKETLVYTVRLRGHVNPVTGYNWAVDTIIDVDDDLARVHEPLWCHRAVFSNSTKGGPEVELTMIRPRSFQIYWEDK